MKHHATRPHAARIAQACRRLEADDPPGLAQLAAEAGLSPGHFQRVFRRAVGVTPKQYAGARRAQRLCTNLRNGARVTDALLDAGYGSLGRAYEATGARLGMTPSRYRAGGLGEHIRYTAAACSLGAVAIGATGRGLAAIELADTPSAAAERVCARFPRATLEPAEDALAAAVAAVVAKVDDPAAATLDLPLDIRGTGFQERVWRALQAIPAGATRSYGEIARAIGRPGAARAVGRAVAANRLAVAIPCHRAVPAAGGTGGYRWGSERKRALLEREADANKPDSDDSRSA